MKTPAQGLAVGILAGGRSRRMGRDKAFLPFGHEALLQRIVRALAPLTDRVLVAAGPRGRLLPELPGEVQVVFDRESHQGPIAGILAIHDHLDENVDRVFICSCDQPFLNTEFVVGLVERIGDSGILVPKTAGHLQVLAALYRRSALAEIEAFYADGGRKLKSFVEDQNHRVLEDDEIPGHAAIRNLNRPEDYADALKELNDPGS